MSLSQTETPRSAGSLHSRLHSRSFFWLGVIGYRGITCEHAQIFINIGKISDKAGRKAWHQQLRHGQFEHHDRALTQNVVFCSESWYLEAVFLVYALEAGSSQYT